MTEDKMMQNAEPARKVQSTRPTNQVSLGEPINEPVHTRRLKQAAKRNEEAKNQ